ncbi:MAG: peptidyl-tRNA hydrolase [Rhodospirillales bacterium]|nr:peptidyl-tRNA hydrolase [Rhodospirillales bacterium]
MILLVGLGNPGQKYEKNRHNIGFMAIDQIAQEHRAPSFRNKFQSDMSEASLNGVKVILQKPLTFMNESGQAVQALSKFYKIPPSQIFVFHDELDLEPGKVRFKTGAGKFFADRGFF